MDSVSASSQNILSERIGKYETLIAEYHLMVNSKPPVLLIVEKARAASFPDKPKLLTVILATFFLSLIFSLLLALSLEKKKNRASCLSNQIETKFLLFFFLSPAFSRSAEVAWWSDATGCLGF